MTITLLEFFFGLLLLAVPAVLIYVFRLPLQPRFFRCVGRFLVTMAVAGGAMYGVELVNSVWLNIVVFLLLTLLSALFAVGKARVGQRRILLPVFVGLLVPTLLVVLYVGFLVLGQQRLFDASLLLPLAGRPVLRWVAMPGLSLLIIWGWSIMELCIIIFLVMEPRTVRLSAILSSAACRQACCRC